MRQYIKSFGALQSKSLFRFSVFELAWVTPIEVIKGFTVASFLNPHMMNLNVVKLIISLSSLNPTLIVSDCVQMPKRTDQFLWYILKNSGVLLMLFLR